MKDFPDPKFMKLAIELSKRGLGTTSPNPVVGCVIVKDGQVVGSGYHEYAGGPHAEIIALNSASENAVGSDVYVTLEPCSFYGRTPPCTEALIKAGVKRVAVAVTDPHPKVNGRGIKALVDAGIEVSEGILEREAAFVNRYYLTAIKSGRPYITVKLAATVDGYIADKEKMSKWITGQEAREDVQELRRIHDAVIVGAGTYLSDLPQLSYRGFRKKRPELKRYVMAYRKETVKKILELSKDSGISVIAPEKLAYLSKEKILPVPEDEAGGIDFSGMFKVLAEKEIRSVLVEGGSEIAGKLMEKNLFDELIVYYAPKIIGSGLKMFTMEKEILLKDAITLRFHSVATFGSDVRIIYFNERTWF